jgi:hypothetical protein
MNLRQLSLVRNPQLAIFALLGFYAAYTLVFTDVSGQPIGYIFKGQAVFLDYLTLQMGQDVPKRRELTTNLRCVNSLNSDYLTPRRKPETHPAPYVPKNNFNAIQPINLPLLLVFQALTKVPRLFRL